MAYAACGRRCATMRHRWRRPLPPGTGLTARASRSCRYSDRACGAWRQALLRAVWRGAIRDGASLGGARIGGLQRSVGGELSRVAEAEAGDVVALGRLDEAATGATLSPSGKAEALDGPEVPFPLYALAVSTEDRRDDVKLSGALRRMEEEDPSLRCGTTPRRARPCSRGKARCTFRRRSPGSPPRTT